MSRLYRLVKQSRNDNDALLEIIKLFEPKIAKSLYLTNQSCREELSQELKLKLIDCIRKYEMDSIPGFWEFRNMVSSKINEEL